MRLVIGVGQLVVVPCVLVGVLAMSGMAAGRMPRSERRVAARAGFWSGVALVTLIIAVLADGVEPVMGLMPDPVEVNWFGVHLGLVGGPMLLLLFAKSVKAAWNGLLLFALSSSSALALFATFAYPDLRNFIMSLCLSAVASALVMLAASPKMADDFARPPVIYP